MLRCDLLSERPSRAPIRIPRVKALKRGARARVDHWARPAARRSFELSNLPSSSGAGILAATTHEAQQQGIADYQWQKVPSRMLAFQIRLASSNRISFSLGTIFILAF